MSRTFIAKFKKHYDVNDRLDNPKEWLIVNSIIDIKLPIKPSIKNIWVITDGESHYAFGELFLSDVFKDFNGRIYFSGNYYCKERIIKHHNYEIYLHPLGYQPFSTFDFSYQFEALFEGKRKTRPIHFDVNSTGQHQIKKKEHLVTFLGFRHDVYRDYLYTKLAEMDLVRNTAYHSWHKENDELTFSEKKDWKKLGINDSYDYYKSIQFSLPKKLDFNEFNNYNMFINSIQSVSKGIFNIVFETQTDFENKDQLNQYKFISLTEKSCFPFWSQSIPLFIHDDVELLASYFTKMGFDLFTDILGDDFYKNKSIIEQIKNILSFVEDINSKYTVGELDVKFSKRLLENKKLATSIQKGNSYTLSNHINTIISEKSLI